MNSSDHVGSFEKVGECLYRYSSNQVYYARLKINGKEVRRSLKTTDRTLAKQKLASLRTEMEKVNLSLGKMTVAELTDRFLKTQSHLAPKTVKTREKIASQIKKDWPKGADQQIMDVNPSDATTWLGVQAKRPGKHGALTKSTLNVYIGFIRAMFQMAVTDRMIASSPCQGLKERRRETPVRQTPSWDEFKKIVANIRGQPFNADAQDSANFVEFLGLSGLGNAEASSLQWKHVDFQRGKIKVLRKKTATGFEIPIFPQLEPLLKSLQGQSTLAPETFILRIKDAKKALKGACKRLGLPLYSHRALRRCFITRAVEKGIDFKTIAAWQGHRDGGVLIARTYSHLRTEHADTMARRLADAE
ncbi:MAG: tyrosine-type recombinase/integrase [Verrucomicrobiae bacterium]|nr:tyrosine-type recombinase/integrase [Verrucomicrobiae bacterium]